MDGGYCGDDVVCSQSYVWNNPHFAPRVGKKGFWADGPSSWKGIATWLILPVVICLSQRLSHACLSISFYTVKLRMAH